MVTTWGEVRGCISSKLVGGGQVQVHAEWEHLPHILEIFPL